MYSVLWRSFFFRNTETWEFVTGSRQDTETSLIYLLILSPRMTGLGKYGNWIDEVHTLTISVNLVWISQGLVSLSLSHQEKQEKGVKKKLVHHSQGLKWEGRNLPLPTDLILSWWKATFGSKTMWICIVQQYTLRNFTLKFVSSLTPVTILI